MLIYSMMLLLAQYTGPLHACSGCETVTSYSVQTAFTVVCQMSAYTDSLYQLSHLIHSAVIKTVTSINLAASWTNNRSKAGCERKFILTGYLLLCDFMGYYRALQLKKENQHCAQKCSFIMS